MSKRRMILYILGVTYITTRIQASPLRIIQSPAIPTHSLTRSIDATGNTINPTMIVLHFTQEDLDTSLNIFLGHTEARVAPHYTISESGEIFQHVAEDRAARHAGISSWRGIDATDAINKCSLGIEHVNKGYTLENPAPSNRVIPGMDHAWYPYAPAQIQSTIELCTALIKKYGIEPRNVVGHSDIAPDRKVDPGPLFPWHTLAQAGIGAWPHTLSHEHLPCLRQAYALRRTHAWCTQAWFIEHLNLWGYQLPNEIRSAQDIIRAFQMHFRPTNISGIVDDETITILHALINEYALSATGICPCSLPDFLKHPSSWTHASLAQAPLTHTSRTHTSWAHDTLRTMTLREKIGQLFMVAAISSEKQPTETLASALHNAPYKMDQPTVESYITQYHVGGILWLYKSTPEKQVALINHYQKLSKLPLLVAQDAEWGLSMRLQGAPEFPRARMLGTYTDEQVYEIGKVIGAHCRAVGVHMNLAPVVDVDSNPKNPVIGKRSFGSDPELVARKGAAFARGLRDAQVLACAKHFPGHGDTTVDSHLDLPLIPYTRTELEQRELVPFKHLIHAGVPAVMMAHLQVPAYDAQQASIASLSPALTTKLLQKELGFQGLVITDGLGMDAVTKHYAPGDIELRAFLAGNDIILGPLDVAKAIDLIEQHIRSGAISKAELDRRVLKILQAKAWLKLDRQRLIPDTPTFVAQP